MTGRRKRCGRIAFSSRNTRFSRKLTEPGAGERLGGLVACNLADTFVQARHFPFAGAISDRTWKRAHGVRHYEEFSAFALRVHAWKTPWLVSSPRWVTVTRPGEASILARCYGNAVQTSLRRRLLGLQGHYNLLRRPKAQPAVKHGDKLKGVESGRQHNGRRAKRAASTPQAGG